MHLPGLRNLTFLVPVMIPDTLWNSVWNFTKHNMRFGRTILFSSRRSLAIILCCLPDLDCAAVATCRFHFTMTLPTVDRTSSARLKFSQLTSTPVVPWFSYSPLDPRFADSNPAGVDGFSQSVKIVSMPSFGRKVQPWVPCRRFTGRKRTSSQN